MQILSYFGGVNDWMSSPRLKDSVVLTHPSEKIFSHNFHVLSQNFQMFVNQNFQMFFVQNVHVLKSKLSHILELNCPHFLRSKLFHVLKKVNWNYYIKKWLTFSPHKVARTSLSVRSCMFFHVKLRHFIVRVTATDWYTVQHDLCPLKAGIGCRNLPHSTLIE